jgi:hypothetical protein
LGAYYTGPITHIIFINDDDASKSAESRFYNFCIYEQIDFSTLNLSGYSGQDNGGTSSVQDGGTTLELTGNTWKKAAFNYTVTPDTVIDVIYRSDHEGEIQGLGMDDNNAFNDDSPARYFQFFGTQSLGLQEAHNYDGSGLFSRYTLYLGQNYTGLMTYLTFINDDDTSAADGHSVFNGLRIWEDPN